MCVPPAEKTFLFLGQDFNSIKNYSAVFPKPIHGVMTYISLSNLSNNLGLSMPNNYGSGIQWIEYDFIKKYVSQSPILR